MFPSNYTAQFANGATLACNPVTASASCTDIIGAVVAPPAVLEAPVVAEATPAAPGDSGSGPLHATSLLVACFISILLALAV
jgi:hypothetical protein